MDEERFVTAARNSAERRGSRERNETPQGTWLGGAGTGSLWLCYARSLALKLIRRILGCWPRPKQT